MKKALCFMVGLLLWISPGFAAVGAEGVTYGAWLPYWETDAAMAEMETLTGTLDEAIAFACIFDDQDQPLMLPDTVSLLTALRDTCADTGTEVILSVVNDVQTAPEQYDNKSVALLQRLFGDADAASCHLEALTNLIDTYGLTTLELDYENLKSDTTLWANYVSFIERLWAMCDRDGVRLRIVLPWDAPKYTELPEGPEYSVMCYNLYGYHSGPGPKADFEFLKQTCTLYQAVPGTVRMAFATGGFDWCAGEIIALTQQEALSQLDAAGAQAVRDADSGVMTAAYTQAGETHEVWYADGRTLALWRDTCLEYGFSAFDLFRLGGNDLADWQNALF